MVLWYFPDGALVAAICDTPHCNAVLRRRSIMSGLRHYLVADHCAASLRSTAVSLIASAIEIISLTFASKNRYS